MKQGLPSYHPRLGGSKRHYRKENLMDASLWLNFTVTSGSSIPKLLTVAIFQHPTEELMFPVATCF